MARLGAACGGMAICICLFFLDIERGNTIYIKNMCQFNAMCELRDKNILLLLQRFQSEGEKERNRKRQKEREKEERGG